MHEILLIAVHQITLLPNGQSEFLQAISGGFVIGPDKICPGMRMASFVNELSGCPSRAHTAAAFAGAMALLRARKTAKPAEAATPASDSGAILSIISLSAWVQAMKAFN
ncbi:MAG: hypothetical protein A3I66_05375 [Burkholderiales bacterium RIFCSPLOWO2_02_FULL_57_36]|nr:MAG: hypothetical protein A3I66_05375 [Burkholderiales bacterium RIFCSPLOWO2_02_FULL_57_36]